MGSKKRLPLEGEGRIATVFGGDPEWGALTRRAQDFNRFAMPTVSAPPPGAQERADLPPPGGERHTKALP